MQKIIPQLCLAVSLAVAGGAAQAVSVSNLIFLNAENQFSDNSAESQNVDLNGNSFLDVGDTLRGIFQIGTIENLTAGGTNVMGAGGNDEFSGNFETQVTGLTLVTDPDNSCPGLVYTVGCLTGDETANYTFGPYAPFATDNSLPAGAMFAWYDDPTPDFTRNLLSIPAMETLATNGTLVWVTGFNGDPDELWQSVGTPVDPTLARNVSPGTALGTFNIQMSILFNGLGVQFGQTTVGIPVMGGNGLIDVNASGSVLGTRNVFTGYDVFDNVDFVVNVLPEPTSLALLGTGLLGLGAGVFRRRRPA